MRGRLFISVLADSILRQDIFKSEQTTEEIKWSRAAAELALEDMIDSDYPELPIANCD